MAVVSVSVRLQLLAVSTLLLETCESAYLHFDNSKIILEGFLLVEFVSEIGLQLEGGRWNS